MNPHSYVLITLLCLLCALPVYSAGQEKKEPRWFEIEMILFSRNQAGAGSSETWPSDPGILDWDAALPERTYVILPKSEWQLGAEEYTLRKTHGRLEPLIHLTWRQPVSSRKSARPVYLKSTRNIADDTPRMEGLAKISVGRYLHVDLDILLRSVPGEAEVYPGGFKVYRFTEHRKMRSGEFHYIDHPKMGALIEIRKVEKNIEAAQDAPQETDMTNEDSPTPPAKEALPPAAVDSPAVE